jgi:hypothetical protein
MTFCGCGQRHFVSHTKQNQLRCQAVLTCQHTRPALYFVAGHSRPDAFFWNNKTKLEHRGGAGVQGIGSGNGHRSRRQQPSEFSRRPKALECQFGQPRRGLDSQALAALGAASTNHRAAATSFHADQEAMGSFAANHGRLICAFHLNQLLWVNRQV